MRDKAPSGFGKQRPTPDKALATLMDRSVSPRSRMRISNHGKRSNLKLDFDWYDLEPLQYPPNMDSPSERTLYSAVHEPYRKAALEFVQAKGISLIFKGIPSQTL